MGGAKLGYHEVLQGWGRGVALAGDGGEGGVRGGKQTMGAGRV